MYNRLKEFRKSIKLTQQDFADKLGISRYTIESYEYARREIPDRTISDMCRVFPNLNEKWLRTGEGDMFIPMTKNQQILSFFNSVAGLDDDDFKKRLALAMSEMSDEGWQAIEKFIDSLK